MTHAKRILQAMAIAALAAVSGAAQADSRSGTFTGASGHAAAGAVDVVQTAEGWEVRLGGNFTFDGAPDARIGFGERGAFTPATDFEPLKSNAGAQTYKVPAHIDPAGFDAVYVWCGQYPVPLGVAKIGN